METFSAHSLKILEEDKQEYLKRYRLGTHFIYNPPETKLGKKFHALISYYLKGFQVLKLENALNKGGCKLWNTLKADPILKNDFVEVEHSFLVKEDKFYLAGRFDAVYKSGKGYTVLDWKMKNLPKSPESDLQSVIYLYCASKIFNTTDVSIVYCSISTLERIEVKFDSEETYYKRILDITSKIIQL